MKLGIIGKPQSGKTTVFNSVSGQQESVGDYSQAVHRAVVKVPDERIDILTDLIKPKKKTYAEIEYLDAAGFSGKGKNASDIEISQDLRQMDALAVVVDAFSDDADPIGDYQDLLDEMILADQVMIENNIEKRQRKVKLTADKSGQKELELLDRCRRFLEEEKLLIDLELTPEEEKNLKGYMFLTQKPILIVVNINEDGLKESEKYFGIFEKYLSPNKRELTVVCGKIEMELVTLEDEDRKMFMVELGIKAPAVEKVIRKSYNLLGLISYITAAEPEVRAWTIKKGTNAQKSAGVIHSDIERGFIRAEVIKYEDYLEYKTTAAIKAAGKMRLEGKEYIMQDGDVVLFRFNV